MPGFDPARHILENALAAPTDTLPPDPPNPAAA